MKPNKKIQRWEHSEIDVYHKSFMRNTISMFISYSWNDHFTLLINQKSYLQGINKQFTHAPHLSIMKTSMHWEYIVFKSPKHGGFNKLKVIHIWTSNGMFFSRENYLKEYSFKL